MRTGRKHIIVLVLIVLVSIGFWVMSRWESVTLRRTGQDTPTGTSVGQQAPDFIAETIDGEQIQLNDLRGELVVINLFASWCGPCLLETPHLVSGYEHLSGTGVEFIGLNMNESAMAVENYQKQFNVTYPLVLDISGELTGELYRPVGLPTTWFIDQDGIVQYVFSGAMTENTLINILDEIRNSPETG